jgi:hypothetical protein
MATGVLGKPVEAAADAIRRVEAAGAATATGGLHAEGK